MKKILIVALALLFANVANMNTAQAQENDLKNFRFGLKLAPSINWMKPDNEKKFSSEGATLGFGWGMMMEFRLSDVASIYMGLQVDYDKGHLNFLDTTVYYLNVNDEVLVEPADMVLGNTANRLNSREYSTNYVTLPFGIKMKTKEIGYLTYFGQFGLNTSIKTKSKATDNVTDILGQTSTLEDIDISDDMQLFRFQISIGGGAEWNLSGSTSLLFGINYNLGFSNVIKKTSKYNFEYDNSANENLIEQNASAHNVALTVGILF
jgi:hypothetical protein